MEPKNFALALEEAAAPETIEGIVVGETDNEEMSSRVPEGLRGVLLTWDVARPMLDYFSEEFGYHDYHAVFAWTPSHVLVVAVHGGFSWVEAVPRHPSPCNPWLIGS